ncbi:MAG: hypothetical protein RIQ33_58 [Bacteroidota bacterium]|jgi:hypothetical protein
MINKQVSKAILAVSIVFLMVVTIFSCKPSNIDLISNKWKIEQIDVSGEAKMLSKMDSLGKANYQKQMDEMKKNTSFTFTKDGKFEFDLGSSKSSGIFKFTKDGSKIITKSIDQQKEESVDVELLNNEKMILKQKDAVGSVVKMTLIHF